MTHAMVSARVLPRFLLALGEVRGESPLLSLLHPRQEGAPVEARVPPESSSARHWHHGPHGLRSPWAPEEEGEGQPAARASWLPTASGPLSSSGSWLSWRPASSGPLSSSGSWLSWL